MPKRACKLLMVVCLTLAALSLASAVWDAYEFYCRGIAPVHIPQYMLQRWKGMYDRSFHSPV